MSGTRTCASSTIRCRAGGCGCSSSPWCSASCTWCCIRASARFEGTLGWTSRAEHETQSRLNARAHREDAGAVQRAQRGGARDAIRRHSTSAATCSSTTARPATARMAAARRAFPTSPTRTGCGAATPTSIVATIADGRTGVMPPWGEVLGARGVEDMLSYVFSLRAASSRPAMRAPARRSTPSSAPPAMAPTARGNPMLGAPNLTDGIWLHGGSLARGARQHRERPQRRHAGARGAPRRDARQTTGGVRVVARRQDNAPLPPRAAPMNTPTAEAAVELGERGRATGAIVWSAFLAAALATMLCFAFLDPVAIARRQCAVVVDHAPCGVRRRVLLLLARRAGGRGPVLAARAPGTTWQLKFTSRSTAPVSRSYVAQEKIYPREIDGPLRAAARAVRVGAARHLLPAAVAGLGRAPGGAVRPAGAQVLHLRADVLAAGFHLSRLAADHRGAGAVLLHRVGGRLWCGYACPQTVWTEAFLWMERFAEGDRTARRSSTAVPGTPTSSRASRPSNSCGSRSRCGPASPSSASSRRSARWARSAGARRSGPWEMFWVLFYAFATYGNAGYLREQVCKYMCPYARFQSAMFDRDTLIITYDPNAASRAAHASAARIRASRATATASTAPGACRSARPASTSARACRSSASPAPPASMPATTSWTRWAPARADPLHHAARARSQADPTAAAARAHLRRPAGRARRRLRRRDRAALAGVARRDCATATRCTGSPTTATSTTSTRCASSTRPSASSASASRRSGASPLTLLPAEREYRVASGAVYSLPLRVRRAAYDPLGRGDHHAHRALARRAGDPLETEARFLAPAR